MSEGGTNKENLLLPNLVTFSDAAVRKMAKFWNRTDTQVDGIED